MNNGVLSTRLSCSCPCINIITSNKIPTKLTICASPVFILYHPRIINHDTGFDAVVCSKFAQFYPDEIDQGSLHSSLGSRTRLAAVKKIKISLLGIEPRCPIPSNYNDHGSSNQNFRGNNQHSSRRHSMC